MANKKSETSTPVKKGPIFKGSVGRLRIAVFENTGKNDTPYHTTYIERNYFNQKTKKWLPAGFSKQDLVDLVQAQKIAQEAIDEREASLGLAQLAA